MIRDDDWLARNDAYLAAIVAFVRTRLTALLPPPGDVAPAAVPESRRGLFDRMRGEPEAQILLPPPTATTESMMRADLDTLEESDPPPALVALGRRVALSRFEQDILSLCVAFELDTGVAALCAAVQGDPLRDQPTLALALRLFDGPSWDALSPGASLRHWRLIDVEAEPGRALIGRAIHTDERIINHAKGLDALDERLAALATSLVAPDPLPPSQADAAARIGEHVDAAVDAPLNAVVALHGVDPDSKRAVAGTVAANLGLTLYRLPADLLAASEVDALARLWHRETLLAPIALYLDADNVDAPSLARFAARSGGLRFVAATQPLGDGATLTIDIARPTPAEQADEWRARLDEPEADMAVRLATQFDLSQAGIAAIAGATPQRDRLWDAARDRARPSMALLADRIDAKASFDDIVLPAAELAQLLQIVAQVEARAQVYDAWQFRARMNRGLGISVLFAGESGTGKTMAAEVIANALRLDLYRIDLSQVVSKYIGETEKNLRRVFDAADAGGAVLFFDEADALFGKRSEVKDSHDRYANIEIDYLLQRIEGFAGLAILATNMKSALDVAFARRLRFIVNFPHPGPVERRAMWARAFPAAVPLDAPDFDRLAKLNLSGGNIHAVALNAAFMAAARGGGVTTALLLEAARAEFRKLDRPVNEADFRAMTAVSA